jgi:hypothetical protein
MLIFKKTAVYHHFLAIDQNKSGKSEKMSLFAMLTMTFYKLYSANFKQKILTIK